MSRKLASVRTINEISPIEGADKIEVATIDNWKVVVAKDLHKVNDVIIYFEIDSFLPIREEFEFLRKSSYKKMGEKEGFRLRTIKLRGQISQGLVVPISIMGGEKFKLGEDVSEFLGVEKYDPPISAQLSGIAKGNFPSFIKKTDEERIQNFSTTQYEELKKLNFFCTEKLDGTSFTNYHMDEEIGVCSRNLDLEKNDEQTHWKIVIENDLENKLISMGRNLAIQGEIIGEGIQKNRYNIKGHKLFVFNIFDIDDYKYLNKKNMTDVCNQLYLEMVPVIGESIKLPNSVGDVLKFAEGKSVLNPTTEREGLVWVSDDLDNRISFKTISNKFLIKSAD